jgi:2'-5' RNA ligase
MNGKKALYLAIPIPEYIEQAVARTALPLPELGRVFFGSLHITIKDLGLVSEERIPQLLEQINSIFHSPFPLTCQGLVTFGRIRRMVLWAGIRDSAELSRLKKKVDETLKDFTDPAVRERNIFYPHLTVGEIVGIPSDRTAAEIQKHAKTDYGTFEVRSFCVYLSQGERDAREDSLMFTRKLY